jgi:hypothetical protein
MKYVVSWTYRFSGSATENEASVQRFLTLVSKWQPPAGTTFHQFVGRLDGAGAFSVMETDNPADLLNIASAFGPFVDYQIYPVVDIAESLQALQQGVDFRASIRATQEAASSDDRRSAGDYHVSPSGTREELGDDMAIKPSGVPVGGSAVSMALEEKGYQRDIATRVAGIAHAQLTDEISSEYSRIRAARIAELAGLVAAALFALFLLGLGLGLTFSGYTALGVIVSSVAFVGSVVAFLFQRRMRRIDSATQDRILGTLTELRDSAVSDKIFGRTLEGDEAIGDFAAAIRGIDADQVGHGKDV